MQTEKPKHTTDSTSSATVVFTPGAAAHAAETMRERLNRLWWLLALPVLGLAVAGAYDWRWLVVAAALLLTLYPSGIIIGWFSAMASRSAIMAVYPQQVAIMPDGRISITYQPLPPIDEDIEPSEAPHAICIPPAMMRDCELRKNRIILTFTHNSPIRRLIIPFTAFNPGNNAAIFYSTAINCLQTGIPRQE